MIDPNAGSNPFPRPGAYLPLRDSRDDTRQAVKGWLCDGSSGAEDLERAMVEAFLDAFEVWKERQRKYGSDNIARHGAIGCVIRGDDKSARLARFYRGIDTIEHGDESVTDSWIDSANYSLMGLLCHRGLWPGVKACT